METETILDAGTAKAIYDIQLKLPGLNEYTRACRGNAYSAASMKRTAETHIGFYLRPAKLIEEPVMIRFIWTEKNYRRDLDNIAFAKKFILDAMVRKGILPGDSQKYVKGFRDEFRHGNEYGVRVEVYEWQST